LFIFSSAKEFDIIVNKMSILIIDAAKDKIFLKIIYNNKSYTNEYLNNTENFEKLSLIVFNFLKKRNLGFDNISNILVNQGPGKYGGIRSSVSVSKALSISNNIKLYGFCSKDVNGKNYDKVLDLFKKGVLIKKIIKLRYTN